MRCVSRLITIKFSTVWCNDSCVYGAATDSQYSTVGLCIPIILVHPVARWSVTEAGLVWNSRCAEAGPSAILVSIESAGIPRVRPPDVRRRLAVRRHIGDLSVRVTLTAACEILNSSAFDDAWCPYLESMSVHYPCAFWRVQKRSPLLA